MRVLPILLIAAAAGSAEIVDRIAVSVGNRVITVSDIEREIRVVAFQNRRPADLSPANRRKTADRMVEQMLIRRELETSRYPVPSQAEVEPELAKTKKEGFRDDAAYRAALASYGITEKDLLAQLLWESTLTLFIDIRFRPGVQVTDQEIQDYFDKTIKPAAQAAHPGQPVTLDDYRGTIEEAVAGAKVDRELEVWLAQTRRRTEIVYHDEVFQ